MVKGVYLENKIKTASPLELVIMAYEGSINSLQEAKKNMNGREYRKAGLFIVKARKIIQELRRALDMDIEEISGNLFVLYQTMDALLLRASTGKDTQLIDRVVKMLSSLKEGWVGIANLPAAVARKDNAGADYSYLNVYK
jgi:flagellar secretion chaperone FliS